MRAFRVVPFASGLMVVALLSVSWAGHAAATPARTLSGEMVVTDAAANRFRIVGHDGSYTAPAGTSLQALDGRNVRVELTSRGGVTEITEVPIHIDPITHGWATVRGDLVVTDAASGRFGFAGDTQTYVAPTGIDLRSYAGRAVEIRLDEGGRVTDLHVVDSPRTSDVAPAAGSACSYRERTYAAGAAICQSGMQYRCDGSQWQNLGIACEVSDAHTLDDPHSPSRACLVGDATVASGSGICRDGTTLRCTDGAWIDSRIACR